MNYPSDWHYTTEPIPGIDNNAVYFFSLDHVLVGESIVSIPSENVNVNPALVLNSLIDTAQRKMQHPFILENTECNKYTISGEKACSSIIGDYNNMPTISLYVLTIVNGNAYLFHAESPYGIFDSELPTIQQMISSFQINTNQNPSSTFNDSTNDNGNSQTSNN